MHVMLVSDSAGDSLTFVSMRPPQSPFPTPPRSRRPIDGMPEESQYHRSSIRDRLQTQLGTEYVLLRELSGSGSSSIFLATETAFDRQVVIKALPPELAIGMDMERFHREIQFAARLHHPHLVPLLSACATVDATTGAIPWFSMPYVEGETLREHLAAGRMPMQEVLRILRELASALHYAHSRGIIHRDIKPENILMCDGVVMITDFGVAKALEDSGEFGTGTGRRTTTVSMAIGTPAYMAPEQAKAHAVVDHKADIYAFGTVAYELFAGEPPLAKPSLRATMAAQVSEEPVDLAERNPDVPEAIREIIMRCLLKDPLRRPHSASTIVKVLDAQVADGGMSQGNESRDNDTPSKDKSTPPTQSSQKAAGALILLVLILLALRVIGFFGGTP